MFRLCRLIGHRNMEGWSREPGKRRTYYGETEKQFQDGVPQTSKCDRFKCAMSTKALPCGDLVVGKLGVTASSEGIQDALGANRVSIYLSLPLWNSKLKAVLFAVSSFSEVLEVLLKATQAVSKRSHAQMMSLISNNQPKFLHKVLFINIRPHSLAVLGCTSGPEQSNEYVEILVQGKQLCELTLYHCQEALREMECARVFNLPALPLCDTLRSSRLELLSLHFSSISLQKLVQYTRKCSNLDQVVKQHLGHRDPPNRLCTAVHAVLLGVEQAVQFCIGGSDSVDESKRGDLQKTILLGVCADHYGDHVGTTVHFPCKIKCTKSTFLHCAFQDKKGSTELVEQITDEVNFSTCVQTWKDNVEGVKKATASKHSLPEYATVQAMELHGQVSRIEILRKNKIISKLKKSNVALRKRLSKAKAQLQTFTQANQSLTNALEEVREEIEYCLSDREGYAQESHILKCENARLVASMVDHEAIKNKLEVAQMHVFQARIERDHYREKSLELKTQLLRETEARMAVERERQMLLRDYEAMQKAYKELEAEKRSLLEDQAYQLNEFDTRLSSLQSKVEALKDEHHVVKVHRDKFSSNLRQFASEHSCLQEQFMAFAKDLFDGVQAKMVTSIDEYERLETAQNTVAEHVQATTAQSKAIENELRKLERETERYRSKVMDVPFSVGQDLWKRIVPTIAGKWKEFAFYLGVDASVIRTLEVKHHTAEGRCQEVISHWRVGAGKFPKTWVTILEAMRLCGLTKVAKDIEETLCSV